MRTGCKQITQANTKPLFRCDFEPNKLNHGLNPDKMPDVFPADMASPPGVAFAAISGCQNAVG